MSKSSSDFVFNGVLAARVCDGDPVSMQFFGTEEADGSLRLQLHGHRYDGADPIGEVEDEVRLDPQTAKKLLWLFSDDDQIID